MKQQLPNHLLTISALAIVALLAGCATESTVQVEPQRLMQQSYEEASKQEFIGFADDRAFAAVTLIPFAPWNIPKTEIWWCPIHKLSPEQVDILKSRIEIPKAPNPKPAN